MVPDHFEAQELGRGDDSMGEDDGQEISGGTKATRASWTEMAVWTFDYV